MYKYKSYIATLGIVLLTACNPGDFGNLNLNPNRPAVPNTASILTGALINVGGMTSDIVPAKYVQQFGDVTYIEESRYKTIFFSYNGYYTGPLNAYQNIIKLNTDEATKVAAQANGSNANQIAVARIMKAYTFLYLTDRWGDIPYSQALQGGENFTPAFDKQQDIYTDLFKELKEAADQFDGGKTVVGDILLNGNTAKWKKFANSLRMVMALRISKADPTKGKTEYQSALTDGVFETNSDNVTFGYLAEETFENPLYANYITSNRKDHAVASTFVNYLKSTNDPRLPVMAAPNINKDYVGVPYGVFPPTWKAQDVSLAGETLTKQNSPVNVLTYAETLFCQAEAAKLGWDSGSAETLYNSAIKASMQQWLGSAYTDTAYQTFVAQSGIKYSDARAIELIGTQKWVALFYQGSEAWAEWRRLGYPVLTPAPSPLNPSGNIPVRLGYPTTEPNLNKANYDAVISSQGADTQDTKVWWDK